jgi:hypothetical protein
MPRTSVHALDRLLAFPAANQARPSRPGGRASIVAGLRFALPRAMQADVHVLDLGGNRIRTLACGGLGAGEHECGWDGLDESGALCPSGNYVLRLETNGSLLTSRIVALA